ncbi:MAG: insulinase family protein [Thermoleophilia bacterium]|nr:insulinase family protein [Thermoleophilia bacterium]MCZ4497121.1 insulinase family protein [Thermoleophilia bacterium]
MTDAPGDVHRITTLADGLRVVTEHVPGVRSVAVGAWIGTGSRHENDQSRGYAHFLEHLLFKGNDRIDAEEISRYFDRIGTDVNAATTREYTVVHARVLDRHIGDALNVLGEMVFAPRMAQDDVDAEREVILEEIAMYEDSPSDVVHELADLLVFPGHALGLPIVGTTESITAARPGDVIRFHAHHYRGDNIVVSAAGALDHDEFVQLVQEQFVARRAGAVAVPSSGIDPTAHIVPPTIHVPHTELRRKDTEQVHLVLAGRGIQRNDERRHAAALLDTIFGNAPSSRLFLEVRERRGLAYSVYSFLSNHAEAGQAGLYVGVRPDRVAEVLEVVRAELDRITQEPPTAEEVELAKGHLEGRMLLSLESTTVRGNRLGASLINEMPIEPLERTVERIHAVTRDDLHALAQELFHPSKLSLAAVAEDIDDVRAAADGVGLLSIERAGAGA